MSFRIHQSSPADAVEEAFFRIQREQRRNAIGSGRCVAEIAADRSAVLNLLRADFERGLSQHVEGGRQIGPRNVCPCGRRADAQRAAIAR